MLTRTLRRLAGTGFTTLALALAACGGDDGGNTGPSPVPADVTGSYGLTGLRTLGNLKGGGSGLPVTFTDGGGSTLTFLSGELVLAAGGSYTLEVEARYKGTDLTMTDEGTYALAGNSIAFTPTGNPKRMKSGTVNGTKIKAETQFGGIPFEIDLSK